MTSLNAPANWPKAGDEIDPAKFGPFGESQLLRYAAASGDDNPLHLDRDLACAAGLEAPPVHGMLLMSCFEPALRVWRGDLVVARLAGKFLKPILVGEGVEISGRVVRASADGRPELTMRLIARGFGGDLAILAEATLVSAEAPA
ncbi:MaoC family dehydratase [Methylocapsa palsarum]|uniref:Acyl dehydratase n=1 Tax=Methylocapsa palsarum TaxID=1612308 RepID=A0A1I3WBU8_9HYPH|nr:MaoC family dehydratase [Methylocapsa palsarum]SFK04932.1 Acyl dehydratase [Methylocapsa palsarum]